MQQERTVHGEPGKRSEHRSPAPWAGKPAGAAEGLWDIRKAWCLKAKPRQAKLGGKPRAPRSEE